MSISADHYVTVELTTASGVEAQMERILDGLAEKGIFQPEDFDPPRKAHVPGLVQWTLVGSAHGAGHGLWPDFMGQLQEAFVDPDLQISGPCRICAINQDMGAESEGHRHELFFGRPGTPDAALAQLMATTEEIDSSMRHLLGEEGWQNLRATLSETVTRRFAGGTAEEEPQSSRGPVPRG